MAKTNRNLESRRLILKWGKHKHRRKKEVVEEAPPAPAPAPSQAQTSAAAALPWNLRLRINTTKKMKEINRETTMKVAEKKRTPEKKSKRLQSKTAEKKSMLNLPVTLSKSEIHDDFLFMTGKKPPSRPKRRPRAVQAAVETLFLGKSLTEIPGDRYGVLEPPPPTMHRESQMDKP